MCGIGTQSPNIFLITGCPSTPTNQEPMQGEAIQGQMSAYTKMCLRDPASILCPQDDFFVTNSSALNQQWCDICKLDSSFSWCKHFPECVTEPQVWKEPEPSGDTMQGEAVKVRSQAYEDLCAKNPSSILCGSNK